MSNRGQNDDQETLYTVPVVGIGASAGGLDSISRLVKELPPDTGMAFVLIAHLIHGRKSMIPDLLAKTTPMPVEQVDKAAPVEPNHIYVIAPDKQLSISKGSLIATSGS